MSNSILKPITVKTTGTGGFDVEFHDNGYLFEVETATLKDPSRLQKQNQLKTEKYLRTLEERLAKLKMEGTIDPTVKQWNVSDQPHQHQPSDDP